MQVYKVHSLPIDEVIKDFAKLFETDFTEDCGEYLIELPDHIGKGKIYGIDLESGLGLISYNVTFHDDVKIYFVVNKVHPLKLLFCCNGHIKHSFGDEKLTHDIHQYQNIIVASSTNTGHVLHFDKGDQVKVNSLEVNRKDFQTKFRCSMDAMDPKLREVFSDLGAKSEFYYHGNYSLQIADLVSDIEDFENKGFIKRTFLEGKSYDLLTQQLMQYSDDRKNDGDRNLLRKAEVQLIHEAASIIQDLENPINISQLAEQVGLNEHKLQKGFKVLYGKTVNTYVQDVRLEQASYLLHHSDLNISEIAYKVGLNNSSYFSKLFKEKYKVSPKAFRMNKRGNHLNNNNH